MKRQEILQKLGYKLIDGGDHWRSNAAYRDGDNPTALIIYKESGVWKDFVEDSIYMPFEALVSKTIKTNDPIRLKEYLKGEKEIPTSKPKKFLVEEKTYDPSSLIKLLPHYDFYLDKGITEQTLKNYKCGLATGGKMYKRIVFPIFRQDGRIHGFSGRTLDKNNSAKWLHIGKKQNWFYPFYTVDKTREAIKQAERIFLVESVGDSISLSNAGFYENCVSFGLSISAKLKAKICALPLDRIYLCFNNDKDSETNRGMNGALKQLVGMLDCFDFEKIFLIELPKNDFGEMSSQEIQDFVQEIQSQTHELNASNIYRRIQSSNIKPELKNKFVKKFKFYYD